MKHHAIDKANERERELVVKYKKKWRVCEQK
jgi:hypothetical protein